MTIQESPELVGFSSALTDFCIQSCLPLDFEIQRAGHILLTEHYHPDVTDHVRTNKIGRVCASYLHGNWPAGTEYIQPALTADFDFFIDGEKKVTSTIFPSRVSVPYTPVRHSAFTRLRKKVTTNGMPEWLTVWLEADEPLRMSATDINGDKYDIILYTAKELKLYTFDVSLERIKKLLPANIVRYSIAGVEYRVDSRIYIGSTIFRYMNNFDCPETLMSRGGVMQKASAKSDYAFIAGAERRLNVQRTDEFVAKSGPIYSTDEYMSWSELLSAERVQMLAEGVWHNIVVTRSKIEIPMGRKDIRPVEFSFRMSNPNDMIL